MRFTDIAAGWGQRPCLPVGAVALASCRCLVGFPLAGCVLVHIFYEDPRCLFAVLCRAAVSVCPTLTFLKNNVRRPRAGGGVQGWSPGEAEDAPETGVVGKARRPCLISCGSPNDPERTGRGLRVSPAGLADSVRCFRILLPTGERN